MSTLFIVELDSVYDTQVQSIIEAQHEVVTETKATNCMIVHTITSSKIGHNYKCEACTSSFKDSHSTVQHIKSSGHLTRLQEYYLSLSLPIVTSPNSSQIDTMTTLIVDTFNMYSASEQGQVAVRHEIVKHLSDQIKLVSSEIVLELFGSSVTGFALTDSDVNINLNIKGTESHQSRIANVLLKVLQLLQHNTGTFCDVRDDFYSPLKVPRILFRHKESNLMCELRAASIAPLTLSSLITLYSSIDLRLSKLCVFFRHIIHLLKVDRQIDGHYPSIVFILFVIHYLQHTTPPVLPVLHEMIEQEEEEVDTDISKLMAAGKEWSSDNHQSLGELVHGLFKYYVLDFNISEYAISIRQYSPLLRSERGWGNSRLAVEDPIISKSNIGRGSGSDKVFEYLKSFLKLVFLHILQIADKINIIIRQSSVDLMQHLMSQSTPLSTKDTVPPSLETRDERREPEVESVKTTSSSLKKNIDTTRNEDIFTLQKLLADMTIDVSSISVSDWVTMEPLKYLYESFPLACIICKRARHSALRCPDNNIPKLSRDVAIPSVKYLKMIDHILLDYMRNVMLQPSEERTREIIRDYILTDIHRVYPKASLELFGSSANGFGHSMSDLDLCLVMNESYECEKSEIIENLAKAMRKNSQYSYILPILSARVPIVKMVVKRWDIEADISLENGLALQNTRLLACYHQIDERVRPLGYAIKYFAKVCDMCDASSGSISSYGYIIMLIHYLQQLKVPVLPVLQNLPYTEENTGPIIDGWNCYFFKPINSRHLIDTWKPVAKNTMSISQLWFGFLRYYAKDFDWAHHVVTMRQLEPLTKFEKWWISRPMAIEDPFNLDHNLGQAVSIRMRMYILMRYQKCYYHHCKTKFWNNIDEMMDPIALCGDFRAPKFILCDKCGKRGHRVNECLDDAVKSTDSTSDAKDTTVDKKKPYKSSARKDKDIITTDMSRSQIKSYIHQQTGGSIEEMHKMKQELRPIAYSNRGTPQDRKTISVLSELLKKEKKQHIPNTDEIRKKQHGPIRSNPISVPAQQPPLLPSPHQSPNQYTPPLLPTPMYSPPVRQYNSSQYGVMRFTPPIAVPHSAVPYIATSPPNLGYPSNVHGIPQVSPPTIPYWGGYAYQTIPPPSHPPK